MGDRAAIFDFDGVIVNSIELQLEWYKHICGLVGRESIYLTLDELRRDNVGHYPTMYERLGFSWEKDKDFIWSQYTPFVTARPVEIVDGFAEEVYKLRAQDVRLAIASSNIPEKIHSTLQRENIDDCFEVIVGFHKEKDEAHLKPHPQVILEALDALMISPRQAVYLGDMASDMVAARRVAEHRLYPVPSIGTGYGWDPRERILAENPALFIEHPREIADAVFRLLPH